MGVRMVQPQILLVIESDNFVENIVFAELSQYGRADYPQRQFSTQRWRDTFKN
jgi:hypothetical protein